MELAFDNAMYMVHENSISAISALQHGFMEQNKLMSLISMLFDPRYAFLFYSPLLFSLDRYTGRKLMWTAVMAEWSNQVLKWIMHGERPYWWVHESGLSNKTSSAHSHDIQQFPLTCETGPGSPSGHAMVTAAVWYILMNSLLRQSGTEPNKRSILKSIGWSAYTIILCCVSLSRIYIAAHFPHQCLLGSVVGVAVAMLVNNMDTDSVSRKQYILGTAGLFMSALSTYAILKMTGHNPMWTIELAMKWCAKPENIHLDTTPFFSIMRYCGFFLGMGIGLHSPLYKAAFRQPFTTQMKIVAAILSVAAAKATEYVPMNKQNPNLCYLIAFILSALLPYVFVAVIPNTLSKIYHPQKSKLEQSKAIIQQDNNSNEVDLKKED